MIADWNLLREEMENDKRHFGWEGRAPSAEGSIPVGSHKLIRSKFVAVGAPTGGGDLPR